MSNGISNTQDAYRKQHSCVQAVVRVINQLLEANVRKDYSVVLIMDFGERESWLLCLVCLHDVY